MKRSFNKYALLTKREFKMASSRSIKTQERTRPIYSHLDRTSLVKKGFIIYPKIELFFSEPMREIPSGQDGPILPARGFNHVINGVMRHFNGKEIPRCSLTGHK